MTDALHELGGVSGCARALRQGYRQKFLNLSGASSVHTALSGRSAQSPEPPARGSPRDLAIGIDAGEIDGPVWSVFDRGTAGAFGSSRADGGPHLGLTRVL